MMKSTICFILCSMFMVPFVGAPNPGLSDTRAEYSVTDFDPELVGTSIENPKQNGEGSENPIDEDSLKDFSNAMLYLKYQSGDNTDRYKRTDKDHITEEEQKERDLMNENEKKIIANFYSKVREHLNLTPEATFTMGHAFKIFFDSNMNVLKFTSAEHEEINDDGISLDLFEKIVRQICQKKGKDLQEFIEQYF